ncbi:MAG TPA: metal-dependent hydrolase [Candidatus Sulfopaludibacter sp.]|nr:metal-dependent hydrolase [Candidatus Sulfopaludibacter sp.]
MKVTYYGHACFSAIVGGKTLLFDPFISGNPLAKGIDPKKVTADFILISHGHDDHIGDVVEIAKRTRALVITGFEVGEWLLRQGVPRVHHLNQGGGFNFDFGRVKYVNAIHSSTLPDGSDGGNPGGFVVESRDGNFYFSGDTALTQDMKLIGESTKLKFAALCLGDNFTMGLDDAVKAAEFVRCQEILGVHYDTFPPIAIDHALAVEKFRAAGKTLHLLRPGDSIDF